MRPLLLVLASLLAGCGHVGAAIVKNTPDEYRWIVFVIAAMTFAVWSYAIWRQEHRLKGEHGFLIPLFAFSVFLILIDARQHNHFPLLVGTFYGANR